jgi:uncharacterized protein
VKHPFCRDIYEISSPRCHLGWATGARLPALPQAQAPSAACRRAKEDGQRKERASWARFDVTSFEPTEIAAAGGTPDALLELGLLYCAGGMTLPIDLVSAQKWFNPAAIRGNAEALSHGNCTRNVETRDCGGSASGAGVLGAALKAGCRPRQRKPFSSEGRQQRDRQQRKKSDHMHSQVFLLALPIA